MIDEKYVEQQVRKLEQESKDRFLKREKSLIEIIVRKYSKYVETVSGDKISEEEIIYLTTSISNFFDVSGDIVKSIIDGLKFLSQRKQ